MIHVAFSAPTPASALMFISCTLGAMLSRFREALTLVLIILLPFHALLVTVGTKLILGPGHAPMALLAVWKEAILLLIIGIAALEVVWGIMNHELRIKKIFRVDLVDGFILALLALAIAIFFYRPWMTTMGFLLGFKYDCIPLIAFLVLRRVEWSEWFKAHVQNLLLAVGGIVAVYGILTFFAPRGYFRFLGYSDAVSLYLPNGPVAAFQQISGSSIRRIQSTFSGPNQFGIWLLIPLSVAAVRLFGDRRIMN